MVLEEQILRYYLKVFSVILLLISLYFISTIFLIKNSTNNNILIINKGDSIDKVINNNFTEISNHSIISFKIYFHIHLLFNDNIHYGEFNIPKNINFHSFINIITRPSNILKKITIIEGWTKDDLNNELSKHFKKYQPLDYNEILANTYYFSSGEEFSKFKKKLIEYKNNYIKKFHGHHLFKSFDDDDIMTIGSLIEKEGLDIEDKSKIFSVILNRLNNKMKLQIDATVIYSITNGKFNLKRRLTYKDLKAKHPHNTYFIKGLPPSPISYVGSKTIDIIFSDYETDYLFYFFDKNINKHIFTKNYETHLKKLNEYKKK